jgi:hypothetical protein
MLFKKRKTFTASSIGGLQDRVTKKPETIQEVSLFEYNQMKGSNKIDINSINRKNKSITTTRTLNSQIEKRGSNGLGDYGAIGTPAVPIQTNYFNRRNGSMDSRTSRRSTSRVSDSTSKT